MSSFELQVRPIDTWPRPFTKSRKRGKFTNAYGKVMADVAREIRHLGATSSLLLMALEENDIRLDGRPRAGAKPQHPGVILVVTTANRGTLRFPCDAFDDWCDNLRAISLHLDALRRIDRYGVSVSGEQYRGWAALPAPNGDHWTAGQAAEWVNDLLARHAKAPPGDREKVLAAIKSDKAVAEIALRECEKLTHPDRSGNADDFKKVQQARNLLIG